MTDLKSRIQKASEFDELYAKSLCNGPLDKDLTKLVVFAMEHQHAQTQWAFEALCIAVNELQALIKTVPYNTIEPAYLRVTKHKLEQIAALVPKGEF